MAEQSETFTDSMDVGPASALAGVLGRPYDRAALPELWHLVYLLDRPPHTALGPEGHPVHGIPEPPRPGMRRMFAGGRVRTYQPLRLNEPATRTIRVADIRQRTGRAGELTIVTARSRIEQGGRLAVIDEQDIVYREPTRLPPGKDTRLPDDATRTAIGVDSALLFQFSALTYNAHRIHYDVDYCRTVEDYDNLVVHGPLQALLMVSAARALLAEAGSTFSYRLVAPLTLGQGLQIATTTDGASVDTFAADATGRVTATGRMTQGPPETVES